MPATAAHGIESVPGARIERLDGIDLSLAICVTGADRRPELQVWISRAIVPGPLGQTRAVRIPTRCEPGPSAHHCRRQLQVRRRRRRVLDEARLLQRTEDKRQL